MYELDKHRSKGKVSKKMHPSLFYNVLTSIINNKIRYSVVENENRRLHDMATLREKLSPIMEDPWIRKMTMDIAREKELEEKEQKALKDEETAFNLLRVEQRQSELQREVLSLKNILRTLRKEQGSNTKKIQQLNNQVLECMRIVNNLQISPPKLKEAFYTYLCERFEDIKEVKLFYVQEELNSTQLTVFYDESAENYTEVELRIFDAFEEGREKFPDINAEILVMVYTDSRRPPTNSKVLLKR